MNPFTIKRHSATTRRRSAPRPDQIPKYIRFVLHRLNEAGHQAYVVGGAIRDLVLGHTPKDFDVVTSARPEQIKKIFKRCFLVGKRFRLALVSTYPHIVEVATYRDHLSNAEIDSPRSKDGRPSHNDIFGSLETDVHRRDFTINALYYDPLKHILIDRVDGVSDIHQGVVRIIGDNIAERLREDPMRAVRAVRIANHNKLNIEADLAHCLPRAAQWFDDIPIARRQLELSKILSSRHAVNILTQLNEVGLLTYFLPNEVCRIFEPRPQQPSRDKFSSTEAARQIIEILYTRADFKPTPEQTPSLTIDPIARLPADKRIDIVYAALCLPLFIPVNTGEELWSAQQVARAINAAKDQLSRLFSDNQTKSAFEIWRSLPRLKNLKRDKMLRFSESELFTGTWRFYWLGVKVGVWSPDPELDIWQKFLVDHPPPKPTPDSVDTRPITGPRGRSRRRRRLPEKLNPLDTSGGDSKRRKRK